MDTEVWIFFPKEHHAKTPTLRTTIRNVCKERSWKFQERITKKVRKQNGETIQLIEPRDAVAVYKRMHRAHVAVIYLDAPRMCNRPPEEKALRRELTMSLRQFCKHKAFVVAGANLDNQWFVEFERWANETHCLGYHDPRCLPFPTFESDLNELLDTEDGRKAFEAKHHAKSGRRDVEERLWQLDPRAFHGDETLHIAGFALPKGFHWDVQNEKRGNTQVTTPLDVWMVKEYVNVFPDGTILGRKPNAWKI